MNNEGSDKAGYILDTIGDIITKFKKRLDKDNNHHYKELAGKINGLLQLVSSFDVTYPYQFKLDYTQLNPALATLNNIITRGLPTKAPVIMDEVFVKLGLTPNTSKEGTIQFQDFDDVFI